jgi:hypothetical protein
MTDYFYDWPVENEHVVENELKLVQEIAKHTKTDDIELVQVS